MKYDEFSFFNQQLAAMLREGIPLEGALRQLCGNMRQGALRLEFEKLEADLAAGTPLNTALAARQLPELYVQLVQVGVAANNLPAVLVLLADHYQRVNLTWTRLKGLMVYPILVLTAAFMLSIFVSTIFLSVISEFGSTDTFFRVPEGFLINFWAPPIFLGVLLVVTLVALSIPQLRRSLRWRWPGFKETSLAQLAASLALLLRNGANLGDSLKLRAGLESGTRAGREIAHWHERLAAGRGRFADQARPGGVFPPLFLWLIANSGEDLPGGFQRAAEIYAARAAHRIEIFLYGGLPFAILALGFMVICQVLSLAGVLAQLMNSLGGMGD